MASEEDMTSDSLDVTVTDIPENLQGYVKNKVAEYITQAKDVSMKIHHVQGQSPKLVMTFGTSTGTRAQASSRNKTNVEKTNTILVRNVPESVDEDLLEVFFESTKKYGGGPVKSVKIMKDKKTAFVEFCDESAVDAVLKKKPIMFGTKELHVNRFKPFLASNEAITQADIKSINLPQDFTDDLLKKHLEYPILPPHGPELAAMIKVGSRVVRGKDWCWGDSDGGGVGTVISVPLHFSNDRVVVKWDNTGLQLYHRMGVDGCYDLKLAP